MKTLTIFGTRPEAIKLCPILHELQRRASEPTCEGNRPLSLVCVTAQHRDMLDQVLKLFCIRPNFDLNIMAENQTLSRVGAAILQGLEPILRAEQPDWVIVQGDTTSAAFAAIAAYYAGARVAHVEAGLRTGDKWQPFPEEINRRVVGVTADLHLAPTVSACENLQREGVDRERIAVTGNPVIDALHWASAQPPSQKVRQLLVQYGTRRLILVTAHRRENFGAPLRSICAAIRALVQHFDRDVSVVYPVHPNPNVRAVVRVELGSLEGVQLTEPLDYVDLVHLMKHSYLVLTDSGGIQEEAPSLGKPVLVLRDVTERPEALAGGTIRLVGTDPDLILSQASLLLRDAREYERMAEAVNPYGDGLARHRIVSALLGERFEEFTPGEMHAYRHFRT